MKLITAIAGARKTIIPAGILFVIIIFIVPGLLCKSGRTVKPEVKPLVESVFALGTVKTDRQYSVRFGMTTLVKKLYVREGDRVNAGSPLVMNDSSVIARSPFQGIVTAVSFPEGELAPSGQAILSVSGTGEMYVRISLDQDSIILVRKGQEAELSFEKMRSDKIRGVVESVYMSGEEFVVRIKPDSLPHWALPGMTCDSAIIISRKEKALLIPSAAVSGGSVQLKRNGRLMTVKPACKAVDVKWTEVTDGSILPDDLIIISSEKKENIAPDKRR